MRSTNLEGQCEACKQRAGDIWHTRGDRIYFILLLNRDDVRIPFIEMNTGSLSTQTSLRKIVHGIGHVQDIVALLALSMKSSRGRAF